MLYTVIEQTPSTDDYVKLLQSTGLGRRSRHAAQIGLSNSLFSVVAFQARTAIGMGRVIGDGGCYFTLVDIAVYPHHQNKGVGKLIMETLMDYIEETAPPKAHITLEAQRGTSGFFAKYGFQAVRPTEKAGMYLKIR